MFENIRLSLKGIWAHKMRSFLTMLGIIIGIASIIAIVSMIKGTNEQIKNNLIGDGTNTISINLNINGWVPDFSYEQVPEGIPMFNDAVKQKLLEIENLEKASFIHTRNYCDSLYYMNTNLSSTSVYGIDADYFETAGMQVLRGRGFTQGDIDNSNLAVIIDKQTVASAFEGEDPLGKTLDIMGTPFVVVGVVDKKSQFEPVINTVNDYYMYKGETNGVVYIPDKVWPVIFQYDEPLNVLVKALSTDDMTQVGKDATQVLNSYLAVTEEQQIEYKGNDLVDQATQLQQLTASANAMLIGIASISLLVGGIGVMNIMLVSVTERTREIGLKKALGAKKGVILGQFLTEAAMLSSIGGALGILVGLILAKIISVIALVPVAISVPASVIAVVFSMFIGIVFGLVPSVKASNLNPIDALRYE